MYFQIKGIQTDGPRICMERINNDESDAKDSFKFMIVENVSHMVRNSSSLPENGSDFQASKNVLFDSENKINKKL